MPTEHSTKIICLTPVKDEAWIMERFLKCASMWADHIIVVDQRSTDGTREIAARYPKVIRVDNPCVIYDEGEYRRLALEQARQIVGRKVLLAIDADEVVSANYLNSAEWPALRELPEGTVVRFHWVNVLPGFRSGWIPPKTIPMGFVDDGTSGHNAGRFHVPRLPIPPGAPCVEMNEVKVLHYQYTDWDRMKSKQRSYQCFEHVSNPAKRPVQLYRQYHHMDAIPPENIHPLIREWFLNYEINSINMDEVPKAPYYPRDVDVVELLLSLGPHRFRKLNIWDADWTAMARAMGVAVSPKALQDPRNRIEKRVHNWLASTQARKDKSVIRWMQRALIPFGW